MQDDSSGIWAALAEVWLSVSIGEVSPADGLQRAVDAIDVLGDAPCVVEREAGAGSVASERAAAAVLRAAPRVDVPLTSVEGQTFGRLSLFAPPPSLAVDRLGAVLALVLGHHLLEARRQMILHEINNRIAALLANVDFVDVLLEGTTVDVPPLRNATPEQRREFLSAIGNVGDAARALAHLARQARHERTRRNED